jgi:hypothetical protein
MIDSSAASTTIFVATGGEILSAQEMKCNAKAQIANRQV